MEEPPSSDEAVSPPRKEEAPPNQLDADAGLGAAAAGFLLVLLSQLSNSSADIAEAQLPPVRSETLATAGGRRVTVAHVSRCHPKGKRAQLTLSAGCASAQALRAALELGGTDGNEEPVEAAEHRVE